MSTPTWRQHGRAWAAQGSRGAAGGTPFASPRNSIGPDATREVLVPQAGLAREDACFSLGQAAGEKAGTFRQPGAPQGAGILKTKPRPGAMVQDEPEDASSDSHDNDSHSEDASVDDGFKAQLSEPAFEAAAGFLASCKLLPMDALRVSGPSRGSERSGAATARAPAPPWRAGPTPAGNVRDIWRAPGHAGDGAHSAGALEERRREREAEAQKRLAGTFFVSTMTSCSQEPPPPPPGRAPPAHGPYDDAWRVGAPPVGRWVLDKGRPRCVSERPGSVTSFSQESMEAWLRGYKAEDKTIAKDEQAVAGQDARVSKDGMAAAISLGRRSTVHHAEEVLAFLQQMGSPSCSGDDGSSSSSESSASTKDERNGRLALLARSCRTGADAPVAVMTRKSAKDLNATLWKRRTNRQSTKFGPGTQRQSGVEEICEILRSLDLPDLEDPPSLPRFSWASAPAASPSAAGAASMLGPLPGLPGQPGLSRSRSMTRPSITKGMASILASMRMSLKKRKGSTSSRSASIASQRRSMKRQASNASLASAAFGARAAGGRADSNASARSVSDVHPGGRRRGDQRSELRRLQQVLLSSDQQVFEPEIWEGCGIEADHLKRQQFATLLQAGLFNITGKKDEQEEQEEPAAEETPRKQGFDRKRVTLALGVNFRASVSDDADQGPHAPKAPKAQSPRKSAFRGAS